MDKEQQLKKEYLTPKISSFTVELEQGIVSLL